jgi:AhpC/TSA family protein
MYSDGYPLGADAMLWQNRPVMTSGRLAALSVVVAIGAVGAYVLLLRVAVVRNHPEGYVIAFALATALAVLAVVRARGRRWPAWLVLGLSSLLLVGGAWFNFVTARVPDAPTALRVGERPPDFTLPDAAGRPVSLADFRGKKPVVLVFYRGHW